ncbi:MAG: TetR/AcrR family transcriptional regulator [Lachnospiraceae bacterium]|nr:TetR/AcrR family transcriptional regulator [Lachnospiraceae bacterium]MDD6192096.1 TetR/AcrR family transcriptional regulator [Lachnospiraceae bacterium]MDY4793434.1 TetR/AcrR family transcriptional regulator [Pararoseburia sp.]
MEHTSKDLRVRRTLKAIRNAFYELVLEKSYSDISITELTEKAEINRKTFYLHYSSLEDLLKEVEQEIVDSILKDIHLSAENLDVAGCVSTFYHYLDECDEVQQKLLCDSHYYFFYEDVTDAVLKSDAFSNFFSRTKYPDIVRSYSICITYIYRNWIKNNRPIPLEELIEYASVVIYSGYQGILEKKPV